MVGGCGEEGVWGERRGAGDEVVWGVEGGVRGWSAMGEGARRAGRGGGVRWRRECGVVVCGVVVVVVSCS